MESGCMNQIWDAILVMVNYATFLNINARKKTTLNANQKEIYKKIFHIWKKAKEM